MPIPNQYLIALLKLPNIGVTTANKIVRHSDSQGIDITSILDLNNLIKTCVENKLISNKLQFSDSDINNAINRAIIILDKSNDANINIISKYHPNYPQNLTLESINHSSNTNPLILYCKGNTALLNQKAIAVIGTKNPTNEGIVASEYISGYFAKKAYNILSGLAIGCDTYAHKGALKTEGFTTAVLPVGLDSVYPNENSYLAQEILNHSELLISEYPAGTSITKYNLVQRDRIVASISDSGIVIQSSVNGGTIITAKEILKQKKKLYIVKYKSLEVMSSDVGKGNTYIETLGGEFITMGGLRKKIDFFISE
jgi:DNA processing protein